MAQPQRRAAFFVRPDGVCIPKARELSYRQRNEIMKRDGGVCSVCHAEIRRLGRDVTPFGNVTYGQIDHIFPRSRGGQNDPENLRLLCVSCNASKGAQ